MKNIKESARLIKEADCILIGTGAGISAAAGINYMDKEAFAKYYPAWKKRGLEMQYQMMGQSNLSQVELWGYYTAHLNYVYYGQVKNDLYQKFRAVIGDKDYFVMTSNVDELFHKNDFDTDRIYTPQGSYGKIQCDVPCSDQVWDVKPFYDTMMEYYDADTQVLSDEKGVPKCPNCGGNMFLNVRKDGSFSLRPYDEEFNRFNKWMNTNKNKKMLLIELGAGYNTPTVIRVPMEQLHSRLPNTSFIRVNMEYAGIPKRENSYPVIGDIKQYIEELHTEMIGQPKKKKFLGLF